MKTIISLLAILILSGCSTIKDSHGRVVMKSEGIARDAGYSEFIEVEYLLPVTITDTNGWVAETGIPLENIMRIKATRSYEAKSNVGGTLSGLGDFAGAVGQYMP